MNIYRDAAGKRHSHISIEWRSKLEVAEVTDTSPAAYARLLDMPLEEWEGVPGFRNAQDRYHAGRLEGGPDSVEAVARARGVTMKRLVKALEHADQGVEAETLEYTRIEMGVSRLASVKHADGRVEVVPPYACVVGERFTGEWGHVRRPFVLLDEAKALDDVTYPDLDDFIAAVVALKDIYHAPAGVPVRIYCSGQRQDLQTGEVTGPRDYFFTALQRAHGLTWYNRLNADSKIGVATDDAEHAAKYPFFVTMDHIGAVMEPLFADDPEMAAHRVNSLFAHDQLEVRPHCTIYDNVADSQDMPGPKLALGYVALAMEYIPWVEEWRRPFERPGGYAMPSHEDIEKADRELQRRHKRHGAVARMAGGALLNNGAMRRMASQVRQDIEDGARTNLLRQPARPASRQRRQPTVGEVIGKRVHPGL